MRTSFIAIGLCLALMPVAALCQPTTNNTTEHTAKRVDDFHLTTMDGKVAADVSLQVIYFRDEHRFNISLRTAVTDTLPFREPLNYEYCYGKFSEWIKTKEPALTSLSEQSFMGVFNWMYTLTVSEDYDVVRIADLYMSRWVMVKTGDNSSFIKNVGERQREVDNITAFYLPNEAIERRTKAAFMRYLDTPTLFISELKADEKVKELEAKRKQALDSEVSVRDRAEKLRIDDKTELELAEATRTFQKVQDAITQTARALVTAKEKNATQADALTKAKGKKAKDIREWQKNHLHDVDSLQRRLDSLSLDPIYNAGKRVDDKNNANQQYREQKNVLSKASRSYRSKKEKFALEISAISEAQADFSAFISNNEDSFSAIKNQIAADTSLDSLVLPQWDSHSAIAQKLKKLQIEYQVAHRKLHNLKLTLNDSGIRRVTRISLQFERGFLERIQVWTKDLAGHEDMFENIFAIGISSVYNFIAFDKTFLLVRHAPSNDCITLGDVLRRYDNKVLPFTRDYSPGDTSINDLDPAATPILYLHKERLINLVDAHIYTDLAGLRADYPNGLVQVEAERRFNLVSRRIQYGTLRSDWGVFNYLNLFAALTKLDEKNRNLSLRNAGTVLNGQIISPNYVTNLDLRQYENASIGTELNLFLHDYPDGKITAYLDLGFRYGHTPLSDSIRTVTGGVAAINNQLVPRDAHTFTWELPRISLEVLADSRINVTFSYAYLYTKAYTNNNFKQIVSYQKSDLTALPIEPSARFSHLFEGLVKLRTGTDSKLFLRCRFFMQRGDVNTFFPQIQIGYNYNVTLRRP